MITTSDLIKRGLSEEEAHQMISLIQKVEVTLSDTYQIHHELAQPLPFEGGFTTDEQITIFCMR